MSTNTIDIDLSKNLHLTIDENGVYLHDFETDNGIHMSLKELKEMNTSLEVLERRGTGYQGEDGNR